jgi:M6 family metalloprotease-like protein
MMCSLPPLRAATPEEFGFGVLKANGQPVVGTIPLLVIVYELSTSGTAPDGSVRVPLVPNLTTSMDQLVFNFFSFPSVNGYFLENSYAAFSWQRAGVLGPVILNATETATLFTQQSDDDGDGKNEGPLDSRAGFQYLLGLVAAKTQYNFAQWDSNGDGSITQDELSVMVIGNNSHIGPPGTSTSRAGANRPIGNTLLAWAVPGQNVTLQSKIASLDQHASFMTITHELSHSLGTQDLYGNDGAGGAACFSSGLTLMTCSIFAVDDDRRTYHLDPWHKMRLGWLRPRIFTLGTGGVATVAASQIISPETPVILYDPAKGMSEYFIVEFRNNRISAGADHDANVTGDSTPTPFTGAAAGMAVWHVDLNLPLSPTFHEGSPNNQMGGTNLWNQMTQLLRWSDGTQTATRLNPIATLNGGRELVFEWLTASDTWVDFQYNGTESGTFGQPFNTLSEAANAATHGGTVKFKTGGSSSESLTLSKRLDLQALGGPVTIGQ